LLKAANGKLSRRRDLFSPPIAGDGLPLSFSAQGRLGQLGLGVRRQMMTAIF
jgi:hypothetical protein